MGKLAAAERRETQIKICRESTSEHEEIFDSKSNNLELFFIPVRSVRY
jgi:hypothetical protein